MLAAVQARKLKHQCNAQRAFLRNNTGNETWITVPAEQLSIGQRQGENNKVILAKPLFAIACRSIPATF
jgi:hypothetical protein